MIILFLSLSLVARSMEEIYLVSIFLYFRQTSYFYSDILVQMVACKGYIHLVAGSISVYAFLSSKWEIIEKRLKPPLVKYAVVKTVDQKPQNRRFGTPQFDYKIKVIPPPTYTY
ncbi:Hypothetical_protein [Hexamita inflata]|uniref:Hypothetical_protein n=1 Tax=Hexamita inflata TaxID=28002 RepID=A0ABP1GUP8_9EUKA